MEHDPKDVNEHEFENSSRRSMKDLCLNTYQRKWLLQRADFTEQDFKEVTREIWRVKSNRETTRMLARYHKVEAAIESGCRKLKRLVKK